MRLGSLFPGIGGFDLGFERAGFETVWQVEIDEYCRRVLERHFPRADRSVTDVREAGAHNLARVDVICGGFPCQDTSTAAAGGNGTGRKGLSGDRSGLWWSMLGIVAAIRPCYCVIENTRGLRTKGMAEVIASLSEIGYDAEWCPLSAAGFGADHARSRFFIVAYPAGIGCAQPRFNWENAYDNPQDGAWRSTDAVDAIRRGTLPALCGSNHGISRRVDRLRGLGNAVVPQIAEWIARRILAVAGPQTQEEK